MGLGEKATKSAVWLSVLNNGGNVLRLGAQVVLARLLTPEDFGVVGIAGAIIGILSIFGQWSTESMLMEREDDDRLVDTVFTLRVIYSGSFWVVTAAVAGISSFHYRIEVVAILLVMATVSVIKLNGEVFNSVLRRDFAFRKLAVIDFTATFCGTALAVAMAWFNWGLWSLVALGVGTNIVRAVSYTIVADYSPALVLDRTYFPLIWKYISNVLPAAGISKIGNNLDDWLVGTLVGTSALGYYNIGWKTALIAQKGWIPALRDVLLPTISKVADDQERLNDYYNFALRMTLRITGAIGGFLFIFSPEIIPLLFGQQWLESIPIARIFGAYIILLPLYRMHKPILYGLERPDIFLRANLVWLCIFIPSSIPAVYWFGPAGAAVALTVCFAVSTAYLIKRQQEILEIEFLSNIKTVTAIVATSIVSHVFYKSGLIEGDLMNFVVSGLTFAAIYLLCLLLIDGCKFRSDAKRMWQKLS